MERISLANIRLHEGGDHNSLHAIHYSDKEYKQIAPSVVNPCFANDVLQCLLTGPKALSPEWQPEDWDRADSWIAMTNQNCYDVAS